MKKLISALALLAALCLALGLSYADGVADARSYVNMMYKGRPASTPKDYTVIGTVPGESENYTVEWTADSDTIVVTRQEDGMVKIDVDENNPKEVAYVLTATITDAAGNTATVSFERFVPAAIKLDIMTEEEIAEVAYTLEDGASLPADTALTGVIVKINDPYSEQYGNITVTIQVGEKTIQCYRLTGEGAAELKEGDEITVFGRIKNYKGTIEFDKGCKLIPAESAQSARVAGFVYTLEESAAMTRTSTVTGVLTKIDSPYSEEYKNITVFIAVPGLEGFDIECYRLSGEGADILAVGDTVTVTGTIKNYKGTIEFDKGCTIDALIKVEQNSVSSRPGPSARGFFYPFETCKCKNMQYLFPNIRKTGLFLKVFCIFF